MYPCRIVGLESLRCKKLHLNECFAFKMENATSWWFVLLVIALVQDDLWISLEVMLQNSTRNRTPILVVILLGWQMNLYFCFEFVRLLMKTKKADFVWGQTIFSISALFRVISISMWEGDIFNPCFHQLLWYRASMDHLEMGKLTLTLTLTLTYPLYFHSPAILSWRKRYFDHVICTTLFTSCIYFRLTRPSTIHSI